MPNQSNLAIKWDVNVPKMIHTNNSRDERDKDWTEIKKDTVLPRKKSKRRFLNGTEITKHSTVSKANRRRSGLKIRGLLRRFVGASDDSSVWVDQNAKSRGNRRSVRVSLYIFPLSLSLSLLRARGIRKMRRKIQFIKFVLGDARTRCTPAPKVRIN